jgi:hypothetical protein
MSKDYIGLNRLNRHLIPLFARFDTLGLFLFSYIKEKLMGDRAETPSELLVRIRVILAEIRGRP